MLKKKNNLPYLVKLYAGCNHRCLICMASDFIKNAPLAKLADIKKEILEVKNKGFAYIDLGGAEPTLYPELPAVLQYIDKIGLFSTMCTNGHLFSSVDFTKKMSALGLRGIKISFHSHKKEVFDFISGIPGSYESILRAFANIRQYFDAYPNKRYSRPLCLNSYIDMFHKYRLNLLAVNIVMNKLNYQDLPYMVDFLYAHGVRVIKITQMGLSGNVYGHPELLARLDEVGPYLKKAIALAKKLKMLYFLGTLPICIVEQEAAHFIPLNDTATYAKFIICKSCRHNNRCPGVGKSSLMARYGRELLEENKLPKNFFTQKDIEFIKKL